MTCPRSHNLSPIPFNICTLFIRVLLNHSATKDSADLPVPSMPSCEHFYMALAQKPNPSSGAPITNHFRRNYSEPAQNFKPTS